MVDLVEIRALLESDDGLRALRDRIAPQLSNDPGHDLAHCLRVALWAVRIGGTEVDRRCALAAALCHDVINVPKNSPKRSQASALSANAARAMLPEYGFDSQSVNEIAQAVQDHSYSRGAIPTSALGQALQDADRLDALGAIGIFRTANVGAQMGARFFDNDDPWATARPLDDRAFSVDHFFTKLLRLPATMCTLAGKAEAEKRVRIMNQFLDALGEELGIPRPV